MIRKRGDSWQVDVVDPDGSRRRKSFKLKADASTWEYEAKAGKLKPTLIDPTKAITLEVAMSMATTKVWKGQKAERSSCRLGRDVLAHFGGDTTMASIDYTSVEAYVDRLRFDGLSGSTINRKLAALSTAFRMARRVDPNLSKPELPMQKEGAPRRRVFSDLETQAVLQWEGWTPAYRALTTLLMKTGCRFGEVFGETELTDHYLTFRDTKNGTDRTISLTKDALEAYPVIRSSLTKDCYWQYNRTFGQMKASLGMGKDVIIYTMRHTCLTKLAESADGLLIMKWAGHKSIATTQRYVKATAKGMDSLAALME
jgi:integrase